MSRQHPIIAVTGSSGARSSVVIDAFAHILAREGASFAVVDGNGFHRYDRDSFPAAVQEAASRGKSLSHFAPEANLMEKLDALMAEYSMKGTGMHRRYLHSDEQGAEFEQAPGTFTDWEPIPENTDILYYRGLHGCFVSDSVDIAKYMDLKIGVVPIVNLEWIQKIHRDMGERGYSVEAVTDTILRRMPDYVRYITPQFSLTDINFQPVPLVDTSNPFVARDVPTLNESVVVIRVAHPSSCPVDFPYLLRNIHNSFMSRRNSIVVPGGEIGVAMELMLAPLVHELLARRRGT
ncbi:MAG: phosphoribulokinase [Gammaproteobacteria bacterium]|jgi:phosphoribulokinase